MTTLTLHIATRKSPLALWQAHFIQQKLRALHPQLHIELLPLTTTADKFLDQPLEKIGGKGLFVKELENALLENKADIAVHSMKDVPYQIPDALNIAVITERADVRDVLVAKQPCDIFSLAKGAVIGTSSLRRQAQIKAVRPDLVIKNLRGNVDSRLEKLLRNEYAALILAAAGLERLQKTEYIRQYFSPDMILPAIGQGALGIECRRDDTKTQQLIAPLEHSPTRYCIEAERAMNSQFGGNCHTPIAALAELENQHLFLRGLVAKTDGSMILRSQAIAPVDQANQLGQQVAADLFKKGAREILDPINK